MTTKPAKGRGKKMRTTEIVLKALPVPKAILEMCAYSGADVPKK